MRDPDHPPAVAAGDEVRLLPEITIGRLRDVYGYLADRTATVTRMAWMDADMGWMVFLEWPKDVPGAPPTSVFGGCVERTTPTYDNPIAALFLGGS